MSDPASPPLTVLLHAWQQGDHEAFGQLIQHVHAELRRMATSRLRGAETPSLAAGDLLHETLIKLMEAPPAWQDRAHFFATVSRAMRSVLVDHARARQTDKRGGAWQRLGMTLSDVGEESNIADLLTLNQLLDQLAVLDPRAAEVLQLTLAAAWRARREWRARGSSRRPGPTLQTATSPASASRVSTSPRPAERTRATAPRRPWASRSEA
jgi:RNA polymerase sigma factor (TIGR02999 family)